jgi:DNA-binding PadR family transcriptional regulator
VRFAEPNTIRLIVLVFILKLELEPTIQERSLRAFLDLAILCALMDRPMTGYEINSFFVKKFGILIGPSMVYSKLYSMERKGWVRCARNRAGRVYSLTEQGQKIVDSMTSMAEEIQAFIKILLRSKGRPEKSKRADCESLDKLKFHRSSNTSTQK